MWQASIFERRCLVRKPGYMFGQKKMMLFGIFVGRSATHKNGICLYQHIYCFQHVASHHQLIYPRPKMLAAIHVMPPMQNTLQYLRNEDLMGYIGGCICIFVNKYVYIMYIYIYMYIHIVAWIQEAATSCAQINNAAQFCPDYQPR